MKRSKDYLKTDRSRRLFIPHAVIIFAWAIGSSLGIETNKLELGFQSNYDGTVHIDRDAQGRMTFTDSEVTTPVLLSDMTQGQDVHGALSGLGADDHPQYLNTSRHPSAHDAAFNASLAVDPDTHGNTTLGGHLLDSQIHLDRGQNEAVSGNWIFTGTPELRNGLYLSANGGEGDQQIQFEDGAADATMIWNDAQARFELNRVLFIDGGAGTLNDPHLLLKNAATQNGRPLALQSSTGEYLAYLGALGRLTLGYSSASFAAQDYALEVYNDGTTRKFWVDGTSGDGYFAGNLGIGVSKPARALDITDNANQLRLTDTTAGSNYVDHNMNGLAYDFNVITSSGTEDALIRLFRTTNTSGLVTFQILQGKGGGTPNHVLSGSGDSYLARISGKVGIGTAAPAALLHVAMDSGVVPALDASTGLIVNNSSAGSDVAGITLISGDESFAIINFGDSSNEDSGRIYYDNDKDDFHIEIGGTDLIVVEDAGLTHFKSDIKIDEFIRLGNVSSEPATLPDHGVIFATDIWSTGTVHVYAADSAGNEQQLTAHPDWAMDAALDDEPQEAYPAFSHARNSITGDTTLVKLTKMARAVERLYQAVFDEPIELVVSGRVATDTEVEPGVIIEEPADPEPDARWMPLWLNRRLEELGRATPIDHNERR